MGGSMKKVWVYDTANDKWVRAAADVNGRLKIADTPFSYDDVYTESFGMGAYMDGTIFVSGESVPPGYIYVVTHMTGYNDTRAPDSISFGLYDTTRMIMCTTFNEPLVQQRVGGQTHIILKEGYWAVGEFKGCMQNDLLFIDIHGYKVKVS